MLLFRVLLFLFVSVASANVTCIPQIPMATCVALAHDSKLEARFVDCKGITGVLGLLKILGGPATSFCSSYLRIPGTTTTITTSTPATSTQKSIITSVSTVTVFFPNLKKRSEEAPYNAPVHDVRARAIPGGLAKFAAAEISSACKCLSISPKTTVTKTITAPTPLTTKFTTTNVFSTITTCNPKGGPCSPCNAYSCCGGGCSCIGENGPVNTCFL